MSKRKKYSIYNYPNLLEDIFEEIEETNEIYKNIVTPKESLTIDKLNEAIKKFDLDKEW